MGKGDHFRTINGVPSKSKHTSNTTKVQKPGKKMNFDLHKTRSSKNSNRSLVQSDEHIIKLIANTVELEQAREEIDHLQQQLQISEQCKVNLIKKVDGLEATLIAERLKTIILQN